MLPFMNVFSPELLKFDNALNNMEIMPSNALDPEVSFGDLLASELLELPQADALSGEALPLHGNALPPLAEGEVSTTGGLPIAGHVDALQASAAMPAGTPVEQLPALTPAAPVAGEAVPGVSTVDPARALGTRAEPVAPPTVSPQTTTTSPTALSAGGEPLSTGELRSAVLANMSGDDKGARQQQSAERQPLFTRVDELQTKLPQNESLTPGPFQSAREDAMTELRGLQQLGQQVQQSQATQPVTQVSHPAQTTLASPAATLRTGAEVALPVSTPVTDPAWGEQIGERVVMMAGKQLQNAEIRLSPAELGPLRVQIRVDDGAANVTFHAQHAVTRDAIEQAMPRLREMFSENGLNLGQSSVTDQGIGQQGQADRDADTDAGSALRHDAEPDHLPDTELDADFEPRRILDGLVDTFV